MMFWLSVNVVLSFRYTTTSTFLFKSLIASFAIKLTARITLNMKIIVPITKIVARERNLFLQMLFRLSRIPFFIRFDVEDLLFIAILRSNWGGNAIFFFYLFFQKRGFVHVGSVRNKP